MSTKNLETSNSPVKTELHQLQFSSVKKSPEGFHTKEIYIDISKPLYGMSPEQYKEGIRFHNEYFNKLN
ncbi:hypothetical protein [Flavobacterium sp. CLA17]|uniref:hypothetical protein n=1 Tax=Flavobacterium sp. CLA17 TaxID=2724135 RepID=UPI0014910D4F|nr:hypothetical protein [Flavobacterium sp. CLA17]QSB28635.1 hypothetical protein HAV12_007850 [Flavobacterium sp. CLA17]